MSVVAARSGEGKLVFLSTSIRRSFRSQSIVYGIIEVHLFHACLSKWTTGITDALLEVHVLSGHQNISPFDVLKGTKDHKHDTIGPP